MNNALDNYIELLQQYKDFKVSSLFSSLPLPSYWQLFGTANKIDTLNSQTDYLIDLYHYREIAKLFNLEQIEHLESQFQHALNQEEFILMLLRVIEVKSDHLPYLINGARLLYNIICWQYQISKISLAAFLNFYFTCQQEARLESEDLNNDQRNSLKHFEEFKKDKYGFIRAKNQDVAHHNHAIKRVFYCQEWIICLDEMSDHFRLYDTLTLVLTKQVYCTSKLHNRKNIIHLLDIYYAEGPKILGACCQDKTISFWTLTNRFSVEYAFHSDSLQVQINFLETTKNWITINQSHQLIKWNFTFLIESNDIKGGTSFTNQSVASKISLWYQTPPQDNLNPPNDTKDTKKISCLKEILALKKLLICTFAKKIIVWNPLKDCVFVVIDIPKKHASAHTITFSQKLQLIFSVGFDQETMIWQLDEVNEDYNKVGQITVSEAGSTISSLEVFDEYGLLVSVDDMGIMRCWDMEKWTIVYRFDLNCKIRNIISSIIKLDQGRFLLTTSRLYVMEFPIRMARKIKGKFKPLNIMYIAQSRIYVGSAFEIIGFNWNNAYIEEKATSQSELIYFFVVQDVIVSITKESKLQIMNDHTKKGIKLLTSSEYLLFEDKQIEGCEYHRVYNQLIVWNQRTLRIYQANYIGNQLNFSKVRQITVQIDIMKAVNLIERDVIGILFRTNQLFFIQYSTMQTISAIVHNDEEIIDFYLNPDYRCIIVQTQFRIIFYDHTDFKQFKALYDFPLSIKSIDILRSSFESVEKLIEIYEPLNIKYQNILFFKQMEDTNNNKYMTQVRDFSYLSQLQDLRSKKDEYNKAQMRPSALMKLKKVVSIIKELIRNNSVDLLYGSPTFNMERFSIDTNASINLEQNLFRRNAQQVNSSTLIEIQSPPVDLSQYSYSQAYIQEDFYSQYYLVIKSDTIKITNLFEAMNNFQRYTEQYKNKNDTTKQFQSLQMINVQEMDCSNCQRIKLNFCEINHVSIFPQIINYFEHTLLITFGKEDNSLKFWELSCLRNNEQLVVDREYLEQKYMQINSQQKLQELMENQNNQSEIDFQINNYLQKTNLIQSFISIKPRFAGNDTIYLQGEYILTLEQKTKWNLKDYNNAYRINQMKETFTFLKRMLLNWQEANKYQLHQLNLQIDNQIQFRNSQRYLNKDPIKDESPNLSNLYYTQMNVKSANETDYVIRSRNTTKIQSIKLDRSTNQQQQQQQQQQITQRAPTLVYDECKKEEDDPINKYYMEQVEQRLKTEPQKGKVNNLNNKLNNLYYPTTERDRDQKLADIERLKKKNRQLETSIGTQNQTGLQLIKFNHRATSKEKLSFLMDYDFEGVAQKQTEKLRAISFNDRKQKSQSPRRLTPICSVFRKQPFSKLLSKIPIQQLQLGITKKFNRIH